MGLELLHRLGRVVNQGEAGGLAATELCPETKDADLVLLGLVHAGELVAELLLGDVGAVRVENVTACAKEPESATLHPPNTFAESLFRLSCFGRSKWPEVRDRCGAIDGNEMQAGSEIGDSHDHLLATEQRVADELARAQRDRRVGVGHLGGLMAVDVVDTSTISIPRGFQVGFSLWW